MCTFLNQKNTYLSCEMCNTPRESCWTVDDEIVVVDQTKIYEKKVDEDVKAEKSRRVNQRPVVNIEVEEVGREKTYHKEVDNDEDVKIMSGKELEQCRDSHEEEGREKTYEEEDDVKIVSEKEERKSKRSRDSLPYYDDVEQKKRSRIERTRKRRSFLPFRLLKLNAFGNGPGNDGCVAFSELTKLPKDRMPLWAVVSSFMICSEWLMTVWPQLANVKRLVIFHGCHDVDHPESRDRLPAHAELHCRIPKELKFQHPVTKNMLPFRYGCHHSKFLLIGYEEGMRFVLLTGNLIPVDADFKCNAAYVQDFPRKHRGDVTSSSFEDALRGYVRTLEMHGGPVAEHRPWPSAEGKQVPGTLSDVLATFDFSSAFCELVPTVPGWHVGESLAKYGHMRLRSILAASGPSFPSNMSGSRSVVVAQFSSLSSTNTKFCNDLGESFFAGTCSNGEKFGETTMQFIWPTVEEVRRSIIGYGSGDGMPSRHKDTEIPLLAGRLRTWRGSRDGNRSELVRARRSVMPHIKTYSRVSRDGTQFAWLCLTSSNMSGAAWGRLQKGGRQLACMHWELGVVFTPKTLCKAPSLESPPGKFPTLVSTHSELSISENAAILPVPYELPTRPYGDGDEPWRWDGVWSERPDAFGQFWPPRRDG